MRGYRGLTVVKPKTEMSQIENIRLTIYSTFVMVMVFVLFLHTLSAISLQREISIQR